MTCSAIAACFPDDIVKEGANLRWGFLRCAECISARTGCSARDAAAVDSSSRRPAAGAGPAGSLQWLPSSTFHSFDPVVSAWPGGIVATAVTK